MQGSTDRSHGYVKDPEPGWWSKVCLTTGKVVSRIRVIDTTPVPVKQLPMHKGHHHGHGYNSGYYPNQQSHSSFNYPKKDDKEKDWWKQLDDYDGMNACGHNGLTKVWSFGELGFYAAGWGGITPANYDLVLDLARQLTPYVKKGRAFQTGVILDGSPVEFLNLNKWAVDYRGQKLTTLPEAKPTYHNVVHVKWYDGGAPDVDPEFWVDMWALMPKAGKVLVCCLGGHGRTGTTLAALMLVSGDPSIASAEHAVLTVRANHCEYAIETKSQLRYLDSLAETLGLPGNAIQAQRVPLNKSKDALDALYKHGG